MSAGCAIFTSLMSQKKAASDRMEKIVSLCKRRGFVFQSSEIYGGLNGCWDYGPLGVELRRNLKDFWWRRKVRERDDVVGMDGSILMNRQVWVASGHENTFSDPMVDCRNCKSRLRADQLPEKDGRKQCPVCGSFDLTEPRAFNLMFKTFVGATEDESATTYLRPETAQSIFVQFRNVLEVSRKKLPFGIEQIGKAFRHEIPPDERSHYSKWTYDIEFEFPFGVQELEGVAYRTDYDLTQHQRASGKPLEYFDEETKTHLIPHVVEPSAGVDRTLLALLCAAYDEETVTDDKGKSEVRTVLRLHPRMAPIKCGIFPLLKNNELLVKKAREIVEMLRGDMAVFYDETGAIGRRYRRQDEAGTPFGITVDFDTIGENGPANQDTVTVRYRDSMEQKRLAIGEVPGFLREQIA